MIRVWLVFLSGLLTQMTSMGTATDKSIHFSGVHFNNSQFLNQILTLFRTINRAFYQKEQADLSSGAQKETITLLISLLSLAYLLY